MNSYDEIEERFIKEELDKHAEYLSDLQVDAINDKHIIDSGGLLNAFQSGKPYQVQEKNGAIVLSSKFPNYGRFIEIQANRKIKTNKPDTNALLWGVKQRKKKSKNVYWYTRNVYGAQNRLMGTLLYGLSDKIRNQIISQMKNETNLTNK